MLLDRPIDLPTDRPLLEAFETLAPRGVRAGPFCRRRECGSCRLWYALGDEQVGERRGRACRDRAQPGMRITGVAAPLRAALSDWLRGQSS